MEAEEKIIQIDKVTPLSVKKKRARNAVAALLTLLITAGVYAGFRFSGNTRSFTLKDYTTAVVTQGRLVSTTEASGTVVLPIQVNIVSPQTGYADTLLVSEGETVTPEDILAVLDVPDLEDERDLLVVKLEQARLELENLKVEYGYSIAKLERTLRRLERDIIEAEEEALTIKELAELKSSRQSDYEDALDVLEALQEEKEDLQENLSEALEKEDISLLKQDAAIRQMEAELATALENIEEAKLKSPIAGEVLSINEDLAIAGTLIQKTDNTLFIIADRDNAFIDFDVYEQYVGSLQVGGRISVTVGTSAMEAEIVKIGKIATLDTDGLSATVEVRARPETDQTLTPGASAVASITVDVKEDVLLLPRGAYLTTGAQKYVYKVENDRAYKTSVIFGDISGTRVEILKGLEEGDIIITSGYQNYIDLNEIELKTGETR